MTSFDFSSLLVLAATIFLIPRGGWYVAAFSASPLGLGLDRFRATCPADPGCIRQFDESLVQDDGDEVQDAVWVAVYRSNQNQPSIIVRDEFFKAMEEATTSPRSATAGTSTEPLSDKLETPMSLEKPVAVAQLRPSSDPKGGWILDSMRCCLKKENMDESCDGGSEFVEALSVGVDSLLVYHLEQHDHEPNHRFEGAIRTKATLFSNRLLEDRGFAPVEELSQDMATHVSAYETCLQKYAERSVDTNSINPGARDRALKIVSLLGRLDSNKQRFGGKECEDDDQGDSDPWVNLKMQI